MEAEDKFWKLISRISELHESGYLKDCGVSEPFSTLPLGNGAELGTLAPGRDEHKKLAKPKKLPEEVEGNYSTANWLSTLFKITFSSSGNYSLLTSDCNKDSFNRVRKNVHNSEVLQLVQIPHHGSGHSFSKSFFKDRRKAANTVAVISSGNKYGHPHKEVIDTLTESGYNIVCTNGFNFLNKADGKRLEKIETTVDTFSSMVYNDNGFEFILDGNGSLSEVRKF